MHGLGMVQRERMGMICFSKQRRMEEGGSRTACAMQGEGRCTFSAPTSQPGSRGCQTVLKGRRNKGK